MRTMTLSEFELLFVFAPLFNTILCACKPSENRVCDDMYIYNVVFVMIPPDPARVSFYIGAFVHGSLIFGTFPVCRVVDRNIYLSREVRESVQ